MIAGHLSIRARVSELCGLINLSLLPVSTRGCTRLKGANVEDDDDDEDEDSESPNTGQPQSAHVEPIALEALAVLVEGVWMRAAFS